MPYLNCPSCELTVHSAAAYATTDDCPRCGTAMRTVERPPRLPGPARPERPPAEARTIVPFAGVEIDVDRRPGGYLVTVRGSLSYPLASRLERDLQRLDLARDEVLTIDLHLVTDIDSTGLAGLLSAYLRSRREGFEVRAVRPPARVARILSITGADRWLRIAGPTPHPQPGDG